MSDYSPTFGGFLPSKSPFLLSRALAKCAYTHAHFRPMIYGLNLRASSRDTRLRSTTEIADNWRLGGVYEDSCS